MSLAPLTFSVFSTHPELVAGFSTRQGGVSQGNFSELNQGLHVGDVNSAVVENRRRFGTALGFPSRKVVAGQQIHSSTVQVVSSQDQGRGAESWDEGLPETDGLITSQTNLPLMVIVADCAAIMVYDPIHMVIGVAHAGWRGTLNGIVFELLNTLNDAFGTQAADVKVAIGPTIGVECYDVGAEVVSAFKERWGTVADSFFTFTSDTQPHLDLKKALQWQLEQLGVQTQNLEISSDCPSCHTERFYSHRAENGHTGRMAAVMMLKD